MNSYEARYTEIRKLPTDEVRRIANGKCNHAVEAIWARDELDRREVAAAQEALLEGLRDAGNGHLLDAWNATGGAS